MILQTVGWGDKWEEVREEGKEEGGGRKETGNKGRDRGGELDGSNKQLHVKEEKISLSLT
jgi:hypothetical protein